MSRSKAKWLNSEAVSYQLKQKRAKLGSFFIFVSFYRNKYR
ncbi:hypothetical protein PSM_A0874 [Pseudoalteromonas sp. SM9913]|nr:hypothetical protein PSM_A0874 [Pseudoalteromonas sp. SM9913]